jgi:hypothetical protein
MLAKTIFGGLVVGLFYLGTGYAVHKLMTINEFTRRILRRMSLVQYVTIQIFFITMLSLPAKMVLRLVFRIKYVWVTPWFNV